MAKITVLTDQYYERVVRGKKGRDHSGRINVPLDLIGKRVVVCVLKGNEDSFAIRHGDGQ